MQRDTGREREFKAERERERERDFKANMQCTFPVMCPVHAQHVHSVIIRGVVLPCLPLLLVFLLLRSSSKVVLPPPPSGHFPGPLMVRRV
jgi:hypothetical protein